MIKEKLKYFLNKVSVKFAFISFFIMILIMVQLLYSTSFSLQDYTVINGLYITLCLGSTAYGFLTSRYFIINQLSFGKTRSEIYIDFIKRILVVLIYVIFIEAYYILMYYLIYKENYYSELFNSRKLIYFISCYLLFASIGFFQGIFKLKEWIALTVLSIMTIAVLVIEICKVVSFFISIPIMIASVILLIVNMILIKKIKIND